MTGPVAVEPTTRRLGVRRLFDDRPFPWVIFALETMLLSVFGLVRISRFAMNGYDLGIFDQIVRRYAHFQVPYVTLKGDDFNIFGDHFHPIVALWAPLYWIWDDPRMLIVGQAIVVAATVFPLWRFTRRHWRNSGVAKAFAICMMTGWPILALAAFDVHEIAFGVLLVAWVIDGLGRRHIPTVVAACFLLLLVREDMGAVVAMTGVVWLISPWRQHRTASDWIVGAGLVIGGLAAFAVITGVVIPHVNSGGYQYWDYGAFGATAKAALLGMVTQPWKVLWLLFWPPVKTLTWLALLVPLGFLPLRSPYALIALPIMAERMLAGRETLWGVMFHYNAPVWIIFVLAAVDAYVRLPQRWKLRLRPRAIPLEIITAIVNVAVAVGLLASVMVSDRDVADRRAAAAQIPPNTCVVASNRFADAFVRTNRVTVPGVSQHRQDFYILDMSLPPTSVSPLDWTAQQAYDDAISKGFVEVHEYGSVVVLQSPDYQGPDPVNCGPMAR